MNAAAPAERLRIAVSLGDPRGIGAEVTEKALLQLRRANSATEFVLLGPAASPLSQYADRYISVGSWKTNDVAAAGRIAALAIEQAVDLALAHEVDAIVTAPIDKAALHAAGYKFPGHTEMLAARSGRASVAMMMCAEQTRMGGALRVVLATTHVPLSAVPGLLTTDLLVQQSLLTAAALHDHWALPAPRLALCAFNPHASDGGLFGDEEQRIMKPALERLRAEGLAVSGPWPADTVFLRALRGEFDAVIAPYHDVGMAAFKTASFGGGVNVTLGLPFPRTSPDHGTAMDIAGRGVADPSSMLEAIELACRLAESHRKSVATSR
jgi:4-hydroxythreonine-4-phosphate dehydrogenase